MPDESYAEGQLRVGLTPWGHYRVLHITEGFPLGIVKVFATGYEPVSFTPFHIGPRFASLREAVTHLTTAM